MAFVVAAVAVVSVSGGAQGDERYPRTVVADAKVESNGTAITSKVTIKVDRLMEPSRHTRVVDGLKYNGYQGFMNALRPLPIIGSIATPTKQVDARYAWETKVENKTRLIVVADTPLFFLPGDSTKAGYELTVVELILDDRGAGTGTIAGAARVKPAGDGVVLQDYATAPVKLTIAPPSAKPKS
jgi:hypothetical protein